MELDPSGQSGYGALPDKGPIDNYGSITPISKDGTLQGWAVVGKDLEGFVRIVNLEDNIAIHIAPNHKMSYVQKVEIGSPRLFIANVSDLGSPGDRIAVYYGSSKNLLGGKNPFRIPDGEPAITDGTQRSIEEANMDREQISDMIAVSEARADAKFERLVGEVKLFGAELRTEMADLRGEVRAVHANTSGLKSTVIITVLTTGVAIFFGLASLFIAMATYGDAIFGRGMNVRDTVASINKEQQQNIESIVQKALRDARDGNASKP